MKKQFITTLIACLAMSPLFGEVLKISTTDVGDFTDFSVSGMSEEKTMPIFLEEMKDALSSYLEERLPEGHTLSMTIEDVDMAGEIQPWRNNYNADIRYVEDIYIPRMTFSYSLTNADGEEIFAGEAKIKDLNYLFGTHSLRRQSNQFYFEAEMVKDWIRNDLMDKIKSQKASKDSQPARRDL